MTAIPESDPLSWLSAILWPDGSNQLEAVPSDDETRGWWWASPNAEQPQILIPARPRVAAQTAVRRYHDGFDNVRRLRSAAAEALMRSGPLANLALGGVTIGPNGTGVGGVLDELKRVMDLPDLQVAVTLAQPKSNRKPVLQLLDGRGRCHGWAKVSWNERTEALVGNEAFWLAKQAAPPLKIPELLHDGMLAGRRVVITSGFVPQRRARRSPTSLPDLSIFKAVAALGSCGNRAIQGTQWYRSVQKVLPAATVEEREAVLAVFADCEGMHFDVGAWHGDFTPWNLMSSAAATHVIDWEFAADEAPIGFDLCHFHTQVGSELQGFSTDEALGRSALASPADLEKLGVVGANRWLVWRLYLVELARRLFALRLAGYPTDNVHQGPAALRRLRGEAPSLSLVPSA